MLDPGPPDTLAVPGDICGSGTTEPDGYVGLDDLHPLLDHWNQTCDPGDWSAGDITGDGYVGLDDLQIIQDHWNQSDDTDRDAFIGVNLAPLVYWKSDWAFVDVVKMARPWLVNWNSLDSQYMDADGWPTENPLDDNQNPQTVFTHVFTGVNGSYPAGDYVLTWDGTATFTTPWDGTITSSFPGRMVISVTPTNQGIKIDIDGIDPNDPPKNIRLWMPGFEDASSPFHPLFIKRLKAFKVIRFMDWQKTNNSSEVQWSDRKLPTHAFQNDKAGGVALEYMVELCNELDADPWFCMPHQADDNYVTQFATYVKNNLHTDATIYVEWSNEPWNFDFDQYSWLGGPPASKNDNYFVKWAAEAGHDFQIWSSVFNNDPRTLVRVVAGQKDNKWFTENVLNKPGLVDPADPTGNDVLFDAIACSAYLLDKVDGFDAQAPTSEDAADSILSYTIHRTITQYDTSDPDDPDPDANDPNNNDFYLDHAALANLYTSQSGRPIAFISYEGGQHFVRRYGTNGNEHVPTAVLLALQRRPMMYRAYIDNIKAFKDAGGSLYMAYNSVGKFEERDTFGHFEYQDESIGNAPKQRAVIGGGGR